MIQMKDKYKWIQEVPVWKILLFFMLIAITLPITLALTFIIGISDLMRRVGDKSENFLFWYLKKFNKLKEKRE